MTSLFFARSGHLNRAIYEPKGTETDCHILKPHRTTVMKSSPGPLSSTLHSRERVSLSLSFLAQCDRERARTGLRDIISEDYTLNSSAAKDSFEIPPKKIPQGIRAVSLYSCSSQKNTRLTNQKRAFAFLRHQLVFWREFSDVSAEGNEWSTRIMMVFFIHAEKRIVFGC